MTSEPPPVDRVIRDEPTLNHCRYSCGFASIRGLNTSPPPRTSFVVEPLLGRYAAMNEPLVLDSLSEEDTDRLGRLVAESLSGGLVIALNGQLGSGKTRFVRSLCSALEVDTQHVNSPTFVLMQLYTDGRIPVAHFDTYRVDDADEFLAIGAEDYLFSDDWLSVIEWAERVTEILPSDRLTVSIEPTSETSRRFTFSAGGENSTLILRTLQKLICTD